MQTYAAATRRCICDELAIAQFVADARNVHLGICSQSTYCLPTPAKQLELSGTTVYQSAFDTTVQALDPTGFKILKLILTNWFETLSFTLLSTFAYIIAARV